MTDAAPGLTGWSAFWSESCFCPKACRNSCSRMLGVGRFIKIGIPVPQFSAPFVGVVEIAGGALLLVGFLTRLASVLLIIDITVAIATTMIPMLLAKGFWSTAHEARADWSVLLGLIFLLVAGAGSSSVDARVGARSRRA